MGSILGRFFFMIQNKSIINLYIGAVLRTKNLYDKSFAFESNFDSTKEIY